MEDELNNEVDLQGFVTVLRLFSRAQKNIHLFFHLDSFCPTDLSRIGAMKTMKSKTISMASDSGSKIQLKSPILAANRPWETRYLINCFPTRLNFANVARSQ